MIRTLYFSTAAADLSREDVETIVAHARAANAKRGVTGALAYNGRNFCQLLEGETDTVMALIDTISRDRRHDGFKVIDQKEISERYFPKWSMELVDGLDFSAVINAMKA
ncbi:MAG: BLUF domain-containing protein [Rhodobacteraceae bacterium]|nr:BLUF domain-containing protein [Paracoccaceae bacterium]